MCITYFNSFAEEKHIQTTPANIDTLMDRVIIYNYSPDTTKVIKQDESFFSSFNFNDLLTIILIIVGGLGIYYSYKGINKQLTHMAEQLRLMETEFEVNSYRYYYDRWMELEGDFTKDVLIKRFPELQKENQKLIEIINFIKFLDMQLAQLESRQRFLKYYDAEYTVYKILEIVDYEEYWEKYVRELYRRGTYFMKAIDNTIELVHLSRIIDQNGRQEAIKLFKKRMDEEWENEVTGFRDRILKEKVNMKRIRLDDEMEIQKMMKTKSIKHKFKYLDVLTSFTRTRGMRR